MLNRVVNSLAFRAHSSCPSRLQRILRPPRVSLFPSVFYISIKVPRELNFSRVGGRKRGTRRGILGRDWKGCSDQFISAH